MKAVSFLFIFLLAGLSLAGELVIVIDDGSGKYSTEEHAQVFEVLDRYDARSILFVIPMHKHNNISFFNFSDYPELSGYLKNEAKKGHEIGLHGLYHEPYEFGNLSYDEAVSRIKIGRVLLESSLDLHVSHFKPPYWAESNGTLRALEALGFKDANSYPYKEYTWYLEPVNLSRALESAKSEYLSACVKEKPFFLVLHIHAVNHGAGLEFLDNFLSFVEEERGNVFPLSKFELLKEGKAPYLNSARSLSAHLDSLRDGYPIIGTDPFSAGNGTFPATQAWDVSGELILYQLTGRHEYFKRAERSARWLVLNQNESGFWERKDCKGCNGVFTVEGSEAGLAMLDMYARTNGSEYLGSALLWSDFLLRNISFTNISSDAIAFEYQYPPKHWRVVNVNALNGLFFLKLWKATGDERYLEIGNRSLNFVLESQFESGQYPYRFDSVRTDLVGRAFKWLYSISPKTGSFKGFSRWLKRQYQSESILEGRELMPVSFQEGNYNSYISMRLLGSYELSEDLRFRDSAMRSIAWLSMLESNGSVGRDIRTPEAPFYYSAFLSAAKANAGLDFTSNADLLLGLQSPDGSFRYSHEDNRTHPRQEVYILYSLALDSKCFLSNCFGFGEVS